MGDHLLEQLQNPSSQSALAILFGAFVGGIRKVMAQGWRGWGWFLASTTVNIFFGVVAYLTAIEYGLTGLKPVILALVFGSLGEKTGDLVTEWGIDIIKSKINKA